MLSYYSFILIVALLYVNFQENM